jgi:hypothetical protein
LDYSTVAVDGATASVTKTCDALICKGSVTAKGGDGFARVLTKAADVIIHADKDLTATYNPTTSIAADISDGSQTNLIALVVNNVTGLNQVATGINISNNAVSLTSGTIQLDAGGGTSGALLNTINQFRGTPINVRAQ